MVATNGVVILTTVDTIPTEEEIKMTRTMGTVGKVAATETMEMEVTRTRVVGAVGEAETTVIMKGGTVEAPGMEKVNFGTFNLIYFNFLLNVLRLHKESGVLLISICMHIC